MTNNDLSGPVKIAFLGHTNTGKTSLIRTLTHRNVGTVADKENATQVAADIDCEVHEYKNTIQAFFIDCPGFQNPQKLREYNKITKNDGENSANNWLVEQQSEYQFDLTYDLRAYEAIARSEVAVYVASLEIVPDSTAEQELRALVESGKPLVAILNKEKAVGSRAKNRIEDWTMRCKASGIKDVFALDAHWATTNEIKQFYNAVAEILPDHRAERFENDINVYLKEQKAILEKCAEFVAQCIIDCRGALSGKGKNKQELELELRKSAGEAIGLFFAKIENLYRVSAEKTTDRRPAEVFNIENGADVFRSIAGGAANATAGGGIGGGIGAAIVAVSSKIGAAGGGVAGVAVGAAVGSTAAGVGSVPGAIVAGTSGTEIGAAIGAGVGGLVAAWIAWGNKNLRLGISEAALQELAVLCLSASWAVSQHCYGLGDIISEQRISEAKDHANESLRKAVSQVDSDLSWVSADEYTMAGVFFQAVSDMEL